MGQNARGTKRMTDLFFNGDKRPVTNRASDDADYVFHELTRSICPGCRQVIDAKILLRDDKVYMSKRCPSCGPFMALVYADAKAYTSFAPYNKPGTIRKSSAPYVCPISSRVTLCVCYRVITSSILMKSMPG